MFPNVYSSLHTLPTMHLYLWMCTTEQMIRKDANELFSYLLKMCNRKLRWRPANTCCISSICTLLRPFSKAGIKTNHFELFVVKQRPFVSTLVPGSHFKNIYKIYQKLTVHDKTSRYLDCTIITSTKCTAFQIIPGLLEKVFIQKWFKNHCYSFKHL